MEALYKFSIKPIPWLQVKNKGLSIELGSKPEHPSKHKQTVRDRVMSRMAAQGQIVEDTNAASKSVEVVADKTGIPELENIEQMVPSGSHQEKASLFDQNY